MRPRSYFPAGVIKTLLFLTLLMIGTTAVAQPDNRYCRSGDTPDFGATKDGPAALPSRCMNTALSSTPSPGKEIKVSDPKGVAAALQSASCGDTLVLSAGRHLLRLRCPQSRAMQRTGSPSVPVPNPSCRLRVRVSLRAMRDLHLSLTGPPIVARHPRMLWLE